MSHNRHSYIRFFPSDWTAGTSRMPAFYEIVYFKICVQIWDTAKPCPASVLPVMFPDIPNWKEILEQLEAMGKIRKNKNGDWIQDRAMAEAAWAYKTWKRKSDGGKKGGRPRKAAPVADEPEADNNEEKNPPVELVLTGGEAESVIDQAVRLWNELAKECGLTKVQKITDKRKAALNKRLNDCGGIEGWKVAMDKVRGSPGLLGRVGKEWSADLDWLLKEDKFTKLMEGNYDNWTESGRGEPTSIIEVGQRAAENVKRWQSEGGRRF